MCCGGVCVLENCVRVRSEVMGKLHHGGRGSRLRATESNMSSIPRFSQIASNRRIKGLIA